MKDKIKKLLIEALLPTTEDEINKVSVVINDNGFNRWFQPFASVCIIINENNEVLLGKCLQEDHRLGKLCFVGGKIDRGENPYEAAERESFEEAGVTVKARPMKMKFNNTNPDLAFIVCDYIEGELNPNDEFEFLNWYSFQELLDNDFENVLDENVELIQLLFKENLNEKMMAGPKGKPKRFHLTPKNHWAIIKPQTLIDKCIKHGIKDKLDGVTLYQAKIKGVNYYYVATHRARCPFYDSPESISVEHIKFIESTG